MLNNFICKDTINSVDFLCFSSSKRVCPFDGNKVSTHTLSFMCTSFADYVYIKRHVCTHAFLSPHDCNFHLIVFSIWMLTGRSVFLRTWVNDIQLYSIVFSIVFQRNSMKFNVHSLDIQWHSTDLDSALPWYYLCNVEGEEAQRRTNPMTIVLWHIYHYPKSVIRVLDCFGCNICCISTVSAKA